MKRTEPKRARELRAALGDDSGARLGLIAAIAAISVVGVAGLAMSRPIGPPKRASGTVTGLFGSETDRGSRPYALVAVDGRVARVWLDAAAVCHAHDRIALFRTTTVTGPRYAMTQRGCDRP